jgi:hypothetical protein
MKIICCIATDYILRDSLSFCIPADRYFVFTNAYRAGVFNLYLLKSHILMAESFAGRIPVLQIKVYILLQDMHTNISLHKHTYDSFVISFMYLRFMIYFYYYLLIPLPCKRSLL